MKQYVFNYFGNSALCQTPEQAVEFINQLKYRGNSHRLQCNAHCRRALEELFATDKEIRSLSTSGCGSTVINVYPAFASTLEEHNRIYEERLAQNKEKRLQENAERLWKLEEELNEIRPGYYDVTLRCPVTYIFNHRCSMIEFSYTLLGDNAINAYDRAAIRANEELKENPEIAYYEIPRPTSHDFEYFFKG